MFALPPPKKSNPVLYYCFDCCGRDPNLLSRHQNLQSSHEEVDLTQFSLFRGRPVQIRLADLGRLGKGLCATERARSQPAA